MNIIKALTCLPALVAGLTVLVTDVQAIQKDASFQDALKADATLGATLTRLSTEGRDVENAANKLQHGGFFQRLTALPSLILSAGLLKSDLDFVQSDPDVKVAVAENPSIGPVLARLSQEVRTVENAIAAFH